MKHDNDNNALRFLSVCSGIEAASVAWKPLGWQAVAFSEIEKFPSAVLAHHYPDVPNLGDFTKIDTTTLGRVDILCGGTPCQAFSIAGARRSLEDERGNLTLSFVELAHELAAGNGLRNVIWENVPGVLSTKDNAFGCFLAGLVGADDPIVPTKRWTSYGMVSGPKGRAAWAVKDAQFFGLAQRRKRVIVVADFGNGADPAAVLFEPESMCRDTPPSREAGQGTAADVAPSLVSSGRGVERAGDTRGQDPVVAEMISSTGEVAHCLNAGGMGQQDYETETMVAHPLLAKGNSSHDETLETYVAHSLRGEGFDASEDGTGRGTPIVPVAFAHNTRDEVRLIGGDGAIAGALAAEAGMKQQTYLAFDCKASGRSGFGVGEVAPTLRAMGHKDSHNNGGGQIAVQQGWAVRRLTPTECERLQGFPDGYTNIPWRGKPDSPDGPRYKALGNSWAVLKFRWLGERVAKFMPPAAANDNDLSRPGVALLAS